MMQQETAEPSPAEAATDDVLNLIFAVLAQGNSAEALPASLKLAAARFTWFRTTLPLVCQRWHRLVLQTPALWSCCIINPAAEAHAARRSARQQQQQQQQQHQQQGVGGSGGAQQDAGASSSSGLVGVGGGAPPAGASPLRGASRFYDASDRSYSGSSTPNRGTSPALGSSPDSESGGYWTSSFAPYCHQHGGLGGASPRHISQRLSHLSTARHHPRVTLSAAAVTAWLTAHPAAAGGISTLSLDLSHHMGCHDFDTSSLEGLLQKLPQVTHVVLAGAVEGTDAYEPLARLRHLETLELSSASQACLDGGLLALCFLPQLHSLSVSLDIPPASPMALNDLPSTLQSLRLGAMWLEEMPQQIADCVGLTKIVLERCQIERNPLPLLLTLPCLASITIRTASRGSSDDSLPVLLPMRRPQQQLLLHPSATTSAATTGSSSRGRRGAAGAAAAAQGLLSRSAAAAAAAAAATAGSSSSSDGFVNTSITSLSLVDVGLRQLPPCISQLVSLEELQLALNHDMALNPATCLPSELTCLSGLKSLCLGNCSLHHLPPVVACLTGLTRLELQGNALSAAGFSISGLEPHTIGFAHSLRVLDLTAQGSGRSRMRGIPAWVGQCAALSELRLACSCLGYNGDAAAVGGGGGGGAGASSGLTAAVTAATAAALPSAGQLQQPGGASSSSTTRLFHHSSSDVGTRGAHQHQHQHHTRGIEGGLRGGGSALGRSSVSRSLDLGHAASAPTPASPTAGRSVGAGAGGAGGVRGTSPAPVAAGASALGLGGPEGLSLQQLPVLLPQLQLLVVEGGVWEQRAVRDALQLVRELARTGSSLQLVLPL